MSFLLTGKLLLETCPRLHCNLGAALAWKILGLDASGVIEASET